MSHPLASTALCRLSEIEDGEARGFTLVGAGAGADAGEAGPAGDGDALLIFVVRQGDAAYGYRNSCPHQSIPLDWGGFNGEGRYISADSGNILCATHGAEFRVEDGFCIWGPCAGYHLRPVVLSQDPDGLLRFQGLGPARPGPGGGPSR